MSDRRHDMTLWVAKRFGDPERRAFRVAQARRDIRLRFQKQMRDERRRGSGNKAWKRLDRIQRAERGTVFNWPADCLAGGAK